MKILIVGAGPSGLMMASCLKHHGVSFTIIDSKEKTTEFSKALGMQARSLEAFLDLGLSNQMVKNGIEMKSITFYKDINLLARIDFSSLESEFPFILGIPQSETEKILNENIKSAGFNVSWQTTLVDFEEEESGLSCTIDKEGKIHTEVFDFVIGCDGIHSKVREILKIPFLGMKNPENFAIADVDIEGDINLLEISTYISKDDNGLIMIFPLSKNRGRIIINNCLLEKHVVPTLDYVQGVVKERLANKISLKNLHWSSIFNVQYRKSTLFSKGRCFLVGDAAHVHSPIGGQGMNTGLQDAYNLAWKLAYVVKKKAELSLLDTYHEERNLNAKKLLFLTHKMTLVGTAQSRFLKFLRPKLIKFIANKKTILNFLINRLAQLSLHYRGLSLSKEKICGIFCKKYQIQAGDRFPNIKVRSLKDGSDQSILYHLKGPEFAVILLVDHVEKCTQKIQKLDFMLNGKFSDFKYFVLTPELPERGIDFSGLGLSCKKEDFIRLTQKEGLILIRPDKYIGFKTDSIDPSSLEKYLDHFLIT